MTDNSSAKPPILSVRGREAKAARDRRLAEALRANLRRRKDQARGRDAPMDQARGRTDSEGESPRVRKMILAKQESGKIKTLGMGQGGRPETAEEE